MRQGIPTRLKHVLLVFLRKITNDVLYIKVRFFAVYRRFINLRKPKTFFAKINWLKLYDRDPKYTGLVDKYEVRTYVAEKIGQEYLIKNLGVFIRTRKRSIVIHCPIPLF